MLDENMGIFRTTIRIASLGHPEALATVDDVIVDTGSEYSWLPETVLSALGVAPVRIDRFETADGRILERSVGFAMIHAGGRAAPSVVVFAESDDVVLLGAHSLEGLNLRVDLARRELTPAGPVPAAAIPARAVAYLSA